MPTSLLVGKTYNICFCCHLQHGPTAVPDNHCDWASGFRNY